MNTLTSYEEKPPDNAMLVIKITHYQDGHIEMKIIKSGEFSSPNMVASSPTPGGPVDISSPGIVASPPAPVVPDEKDQVQPVAGRDYPDPDVFFSLPEPRGYDPNKCTEEITTLDILLAIRSKEFKDYIRHSLIPEYTLLPPTTSKQSQGGWQERPHT